MLCIANSIIPHLFSNDNGEKLFKSFSNGMPKLARRPFEQEMLCKEIHTLCASY